MMKFLSGMLVDNNIRLIRVSLHDGSWLAFDETNRVVIDYYKPIDICITGFKDVDAANEGCLECIVRELYNMPTQIVVVYRETTNKWHVTFSGSTHFGDLGIEDTRISALKNAIDVFYKT